MKAFLSLLAILWNSTFKWVYLSCSPLLFTFLFLAICKAFSNSHFAFLHFFFLGMVLIPVSCTMSQTSIHSSSDTVSIIYNPLNLFLTSTVFTIINPHFLCLLHWQVGSYLLFLIHSALFHSSLCRKRLVFQTPSQANDLCLFSLDSPGGYWEKTGKNYWKE